MSFSFSLFLPSGFSFPCRRSKGARVPETPCLFGNQTAVFLKCAEIDCALESAKKPRTAGLCGRAAGACDCGLLSCAFIERVNKGRKPPKRDRIGRKNTLEKAHFSEIGVVLKRYFHTSPTNAATFASRDCGGYTRHPIPRTAHSGSHAETRGISDGGAISTLGAFCAVRKPCVAGCQNRVLCRFQALVRCAPEECREPAGQRCAYARRCSEASRPRWAA